MRQLGPDLPKKLSFAQNLLSHCHFLMLYFVFDNFLGFILYLAIFEGSFCFLAIFEGIFVVWQKINLLWQAIYATEQMFIAVNEQILKK